jgi:hypothetical protein
MNRSTPWYKNVSTLISVLALLFSFGTTYVSNKRTEAQDIINLKSDLRNILQRISDIPSRLTEININYSNNPGVIAILGGQLNQENSLFATQASDLVSKLPSDKVSAIELYSIAVSFQFSYQNEKAEKFYQLSFIKANEADDMNTALSAKRGIANINFILGKPEVGRVQFQEALAIFETYKGYNDFTKKGNHILTLINWATAEASMGFIDLAKQKLDQAESIANSLTPSPNKNQLVGQIAQTRSQIFGPTKQ